MKGGILTYIYKRIKAYLYTLIKEGPKGVFRRINRYYEKLSYVIKTRNELVPKDFLFISGCFLDNPHRHRCENPAEQLRKHGLVGDVVYFYALGMEMVNFYDVFIFYRLPITPEIRQFIKKAKSQNKLCIFDIDDLMFDEKYVKGKYELSEMSKDELEVYMDGIRRTGETLAMCDYAMTTTKTLARELEPYVKEVFINRNSMSDEYIRLCEKEYEASKDIRTDEVFLGYMSGSPTHDKDFEMIEDVIIRMLEKYPKVKLLIVGYLKLSKKFDAFEDRIIREGFVDWRKLPELNNKCDINLAPSEDTLFNNAKSEIKYLEAALLRKPTVASATNPFKHSIKHGDTSFLAKDAKDWEKYLSLLIEDDELREKVGQAGYKFVKEKYNTEEIGKGLLKFLDNIRKRKITYVFPSLFLSGGNLVCLEHLTRLQKRGYNVSIVDYNNDGELSWFDVSNIPISTRQQIEKSNPTFDILVATMWSTVDPALSWKASKKYYLVQEQEYRFYQQGTKYWTGSRESYAKDITYLTVSKWCQKWLKKEFGKEATYIPNGLNPDRFYPCENRTFHSPPRILIEGDPYDKRKNIDEAFKIIRNLGQKVEVWLVSYGSKPPKREHKVDRMFNQQPFEKMRDLYCQCDILLKTSWLDAFSYPPLEMMACGGLCMVSETEGNIEYVKNGYNALTYKVGDVDTAVKQVRRLIEDKNLQKKLVKNGLETARKRDWKESIDILEEIFGKA